MTAFVIAVLCLLAGDVVYSSFVCTPKTFDPQSTMSIDLRCDPPLEEALIILAIHIWKKSDVVQEEDKQPQGNTETDQSQNENQDQPANVENTKGTQQNQKEIPAYPRYNNANKNIKFKRSTTNGFIGGTITSDNNKVLQPDIDRFAIDGNIKKPFFLSIKINNPDEKDVGIYQCEATYLDGTGAVKTTSEIAQVQTEVEITVDDLETRVKKIEDDVSLYTEISKQVIRFGLQMKAMNMYVQDNVATLGSQVKDLFDSVDDLIEQVANLNYKAKDLEDKLANQGSARQIPDINEPNEYEKESQRREEELAKVRNTVEHMERTQLQALAKHLKELRDDQANTQNEVNKLDLALNAEIRKRLQTLEKFNWQVIEQRVDDLQVKTIPVLIKNISDCERSIAELQTRRFVELQDEPGVENVPETVIELQPTPTPPPTPATTVAPQTTTATLTGPACYECGVNETEEHCPPTMIMNAKQCPPKQPYCITDVYQDGFTRHVYKRCASERDCQVGNSKSSPSCKTDPFINATTMECHFCCTSTLCNVSLRPEQDLYNR